MSDLDATLFVLAVLAAIALFKAKIRVVDADTPHPYWVRRIRRDLAYTKALNKRKKL